MVTIARFAVHSLVHSAIAAKAQQVCNLWDNYGKRCTLSENNGGTVAGRAENLKPWKPGQSGNPGGRPKRDLAAEIARAIFERNPETIERAFSAELRKGNSKVFTALADRAYGKPRQQIEWMGEDGGPTQSSIVVLFVETDDQKKAQ